MYKETTGENISRREFLFQLAAELAAEYKELRGKTTQQNYQVQIHYYEKLVKLNIVKDTKLRKSVQDARKNIFDDKMIFKKKYLYINKRVILFKPIIETKQKKVSESSSFYIHSVIN